MRLITILPVGYRPSILELTDFTAVYVDDVVVYGANHFDVVPSSGTHAVTKRADRGIVVPVAVSCQNSDATCIKGYGVTHEVVLFVKGQVDVAVGTVLLDVDVEGKFEVGEVVHNLNILGPQLIYNKSLWGKLNGTASCDLEPFLVLDLRVHLQGRGQSRN